MPYILLRVTSLEQFILREFSGEEARPNATVDKRVIEKKIHDCCKKVLFEACMGEIAECCQKLDVILIIK